MSDSRSAARLEPNLSPPQAGSASSGERVIEIAPAQPSPVAAVPSAVSMSRAAGALAPAPTDPDLATTPSAGLDQLSRIEDKTARIEEKYARSEARMQRVVDKVDAAMDRMGNVALQSDLAAVRGEVGLIARRMKALPGFGAMLLSALVTAVLTAAIIIALLRYYPALLAR